MLFNDVVCSEVKNKSNTLSYIIIPSYLYIIQHPSRVRLRKVGLEYLNTFSFLWIRQNLSLFTTPVTGEL